MTTLKDSVVINRPPEVVFEWFAHFTENYRTWHKDHVLARWVKGKNFEKGSVLYAEEYLGGKLEKLSFEITNCVPNELIEYKVSFPASIVCSGGSFSIKPSNGGSVFTATLSFRFGGVISKVTGKRAEAIRLHMKEEGENLKALLEK
ncbi:SRPBCC family protein [Methanosarcina sp. T3]|uniref:SRPBCC family protein n=1 Tax=Methanosarcina sp. T3 TaxID=3439062 RepID=UPI003F876A60